MVEALKEIRVKRKEMATSFNGNQAEEQGLTVL